ncbi:MAG: hypothetical protein AB7I50_02820 [Vicinamibacterales bacterium]
MRPDQLQELRALLDRRRVLSLAVVADSQPVIGLLPFACMPDYRALVVHASRLARHTRGLTPGSSFDVLIHEPEDGADAMQVKRVTLRGVVGPVERDSGAYAVVRQRFLERFPEAESITELGDFSFYVLLIHAGRLVTGFAGAANVTQDALSQLASMG